MTKTILKVGGIAFLTIGQIFSAIAENETKVDQQVASADSQVVSGLSVHIDPETGALISRPVDLSSEKATESKKLNSSSQPNRAVPVDTRKVLMTDMGGGMMKIELGKEFMTPLVVSLDEHGDLVHEGHKESADKIEVQND